MKQTSRALSARGPGSVVPAAGGFTLLELLLSLMLLSIVSAVTYLTVATVITAWKKGTRMSDELNHGDFVMEQLIMALRSAYYPDSRGVAPAYGFQLTDNGNGPGSSDVISWVKLGSALVGKNCPFAGSPHRVEFSVAEDDEGESGASVRAWQLIGQPEEFDSDTIPATFISRQIVGFNCRAAYKRVEESQEIDWKDEWTDKDTNHLPTVMELTLYMEPPAEGEEPLEIKRVLNIPLGPLSWRYQ